MKGIPTIRTLPFDIKNTTILWPLQMRGYFFIKFKNHQEVHEKNGKLEYKKDKQR
jgi:hypothetical protein